MIPFDAHLSSSKNSKLFVLKLNNEYIYKAQKYFISFIIKSYRSKNCWYEQPETFVKKLIISLYNCDTKWSILKIFFIVAYHFQTRFFNHRFYSKPYACLQYAFVLQCSLCFYADLLAWHLLDFFVLTLNAFWRI